MALKLPNSIGGKRDLILATRQIEKLLSERIQDEVREKYDAPKTGTGAGSDILRQLLELNDLSDDNATLKQIIDELEEYKQHAPRIRISFAQEPDQELYQKTVAWFRSEIHPNVLVQIGVQPTIGGGFILATQVRRYDFSLKTKIMSSTPKFLEVLGRSIGRSAPAAPAQPVVPAQTPPAAPNGGQAA